MRLIDADKLETTAVLGVQLQHADSRYYYFYEEGTIDNAPTVEAIPIDKPFLKMRYGDYVVYNKKWLVNHLQTEWNILQGKEYQPSIPIEWIEKWFSQFYGEQGLEWNRCKRFMLEDWEKENEHKESD